MHPEAWNFIKDSMPSVAVDVVEFGSRNLNGTARTTVPDCKSWVGVDLQDGKDVDMVGDAQLGSFPAEFLAQYGFADIVVIAEVLEHATKPFDMLQNARIILRSGGRVIVTTAGPARKPHSGVDGGPLRKGEHYQNLTLANMMQILNLSGFRTLYLEYARGSEDVHAIGERLSIGTAVA